MIDEILKEFLANEKSEMREINKMCSKITEALKFQHMCHIEDLNIKYSQCITQLETINDDCY